MGRFDRGDGVGEFFFLFQLAVCQPEDEVVHKGVAPHEACEGDGEENEGDVESADGVDVPVDSFAGGFPFDFKALFDGVFIGGPPEDEAADDEEDKYGAGCAGDDFSGVACEEVSVEVSDLCEELFVVLALVEDLSCVGVEVECEEGFFVVFLFVFFGFLGFFFFAFGGHGDHDAALGIGEVAELVDFFIGAGLPGDGDELVGW